jgi:hypothetical protein
LDYGFCHTPSCTVDIFISLTYATFQSEMIKKMAELKVNIWYKYQGQVIHFLAGAFKKM